MPRALILALVGSIALHALFLFGEVIEWPGQKQEVLLLQAELRPPPPPPAAVRPSPVRKPEKAMKLIKSLQPRQTTVLSRPEPQPASVPPPAEVAAAEPEPEPEKAEPVVAAPPLGPMLPASGAIRFAIYKESLGLQVGRAEHRWEFTEDGHYFLSNVTETSGLVGFFRPITVRAESRGRLVAGGLQPESYRTWRNGEDNRDGADFDWSKQEVHLARDDSVKSVEIGAQDLLSLTYQLGYLDKPEQGGSIGLVTVRKYEHYRLESLGEEDIDIPAGHFHTLHLLAKADTSTEIWIALDLHRLPVKIRFTDKKGDSFLQIATEIGSLVKIPLP